MPISFHCKFVLFAVSLQLFFHDDHCLPFFSRSGRYDMDANPGSVTNRRMTDIVATDDIVMVGPHGVEATRPKKLGFFEKLACSVGGLFGSSSLKCRLRRRPPVADNPIDNTANVLIQDGALYKLEMDITIRATRLTDVPSNTRLHHKQTQTDAGTDAGPSPPHPHHPDDNSGPSPPHPHSDDNTDALPPRRPDTDETAGEEVAVPHRPIDDADATETQRTGQDAETQRTGQDAETQSQAETAGVSQQREGGTQTNVEEGHGGPPHPPAEPNAPGQQPHARPRPDAEESGSAAPHRDQDEPTIESDVQRAQRIARERETKGTNAIIDEADKAFMVNRGHREDYIDGVNDVMRDEMARLPPPIEPEVLWRQQSAATLPATLRRRVDTEPGETVEVPAIRRTDDDVEGVLPNTPEGDQMVNQYRQLAAADRIDENIRTHPDINNQRIDADGSISGEGSVDLNSLNVNRDEKKKYLTTFQKAMMTGALVAGVSFAAGTLFGLTSEEMGLISSFDFDEEEE